MQSIWDGIREGMGYILAFFYSIVPNVGFAIIMLTIVVRLILFPLTAKQAKSMIAMQRAQPEIKKLQAKYKNDKQKLNEEMMKFYKENSINPLGGCLPLLAQTPIFIALFGDRLDGDAVHPAFFQQRQTMRNQTQVNPQMQIIGKVMPVIFGFISLNIPAGVVLYFLTSNIWQIGQQELVYRTIGTAAGPPKGKKAKVGKGDGSAPPVIEAKSTESTPPPASGGVKGLFKSLSPSSSASAPTPDDPAPSENGKPPPSGAKSSGAKSSGGKGSGGKSQPAKRAPSKSAPAKSTPSTAKKSTSGGTTGSQSGARRKNNRKRKR